MFKKMLIITLVLASMPALAYAGPRVDAKVINNTNTTIEYQSSTSCTGSWADPWPDILSGQSETSNVTSPFSTSVSCRVEYERDDNGRYCRFQISRLRSSLSGPWNYPQVFTTKSSSGITCSHNFTSVSFGSDGDFSVELELD
ncbi:hypothetical protein [Lentilitoribacter sp. Alg239-R112]|uniref:hypothetical protein n=1 Tax=Lentilitoribacter sp. Alg239-R112 TaxID=2305987 RepID=UPI0013A6BB13|nr:hypothetical protein [Lentilitoribacter sp. Alg239-R112]